MHGYVDPKSGDPAPLISDELKEIISDNEAELNAAIV